MAAVVEAAEERPSLVEQLEKQCVIEPPNYADPTQPDVIWGRSVKEVVTIHADAEDADSPEPDYVEKKAALKAVKKDGQALERCSAELRADKKVATAAVKSDGLALRHASRDLRADKDVVLAAVRTHQMAIHYASAELQCDYDVVFAAVCTVHGEAEDA